MKQESSVSRDKNVMRAARRLYWDAQTKGSKKYLIPTVTLHAPFYFINHVFIPLQIAYALEAIVDKQFDRVSHYALVILGATILANVLLVIATHAFNRNGAEGAEYVQQKVFNNYLAKDYEFFANHHIGALGSQATRLREGFLVFNRICFFDIPRTGTVIIAGLAVVAIKSWQLALITIACILLVLSFTFVTGRLRLRYRREVSHAANQLSAVLGDALSHGTTVKSFGNEPFEAKRLAKDIHAWQRVQLKSWDLFSPVNFGRNILLAATTSILLVTCGYLFKNGHVTFATVALVQFYVIKLLNASIEVAEIVKQYDAAMGQAYQAVATMLIPSAIEDPKRAKHIPSPARPRLSLENVSFSYPEMKNKTLAVQDISINIRPGEKIGLVGYSGSGKSTLSKLILRFVDPTSGSISINDVDIRHVKQHELRQLISYVPQEPLLFHRSIRENIAYARPDATSKEVLDAAYKANVDEFADELPHGLDTQVGERGIKLSGGQRQRVAIARAILKDAPILVLDEATSALDSKSEVFIQKALWKLLRGRTAIVIAHRLSTIQKLDRIFVLDKGVVVEQGTHQELLAKKGIYADLWAHQSGGYIGAKEPTDEDSPKQRTKIGETPKNDVY